MKYLLCGPARDTESWICLFFFFFPSCIDTLCLKALHITECSYSTFFNNAGSTSFIIQT